MVSSDSDITYDQLVVQVQQSQGDKRREAFNELIRRFEQAGLGWAYQLLQEREAAEDALQEAALNAFLHLDQLQEPKAFPAWFRQIVFHTCHRMMRREHEDISLHHYDEAQPDPSEEAEDSEAFSKLNEAVLQLPEHERVVTQLFYFGDYSQNEIAVTLAVPLTTVKKRLQYAREHLKGLIGRDITALLASYPYSIHSQYELFDAYALNGGCTAAAVQQANDLPYVPDLVLEYVNHVESEILCAY